MKGRPLRTRRIKRTPHIVPPQGLLGLGDNVTVIAACERIRAALRAEEQDRTPRCCK